MPAPGRHRVWRRLSPAVIAGIYAVLGFAWIIGSDLLAVSIGMDGLDINLSLVKGIGYVAITGALLFVVLRRREEWLTAAGSQLTRWVAAGPEPDPDHLRVLIIDTADDDRASLREAVEATEAGTVTVEEAATAEQGRRAILRREHDVILVDQQLGRVSGLDLIRELHAVASGPMIVVTATDDPEIDREAQRVGAHDYLLKHEVHASWIGRTLRYAAANWRTQRELVRTRHWYSDIVQETPVGLFRSTPDGGLMEANPALLEIFGASSIEDIRERGLASLYRDRRIRADLIGRVSRGETIEDEDLPMQRLDGTPIEVRMRMRGVSDADGLLALHGALVDVTVGLDNERRLWTQASMLDQVKNAVVRTDLNGVVTYWNRAAEALFGWTAHEALGRRVIELTPAPSELGRSNDIMVSMAEHGSWEGEFRCRRMDWSEFPAYVSNAVVTDPDGNATGYVGITVDLTDLRHAEEQAAAQGAMAASVLETVHFPAAVLDDAGSIIAVNGAWTDNAVANNAILDAVGVGVNYLEVCDRSAIPDATAVGSGIREVLAGSTARFSHEYPCADKWFRLEVAQAVEPLGGAVGMHIDITDLRKAALQAEEFARSKDRLIASVSHELRTPLTAVLGFANLIEDPQDLDADEVSQFASEIHRQATDMAGIVEDLLVAARAEMGALTVRIDDVDVSREIQDVTSALRHHPSVSVEVHTDSVPLIRADPLRLRQILRNLVNNAVRYGGSHVRIDAVTTAENVAVRVADDGDGVPADLAEAIFEPFFSAHDRSGQPDSLGLGLSVVRTLAVAMGGTAAISAEEGWTVFTVTLPRADL
ncbi:MAG: PAS domain S-box protein [Acidimicrobiia bacterium]